MKAKYNFYPYLFMLILYGLLAVYSSSAVFSYVKYSSQYYMFIKQLIAIFFGYILFLLARWGLKELSPKGIFTLFSWILGAISIITLIWVTLKGVRFNNATRWIKLGPILLQPAELFKLTAIIIMSTIFDKSGRIQLNGINIFSFIVILGGLLAIIFEPDFSTTLLIALVLITIFFISNIPFKTTGAIMLVLLLLGVIFIVISPYRLQRFKSHFSHDKRLAYSSKYQVIQSKKAIKDGGIFGRGLGKSKRKIFYLPQAWSDYILAIILEESGIIGFGVLVFLYFMILLKLFHIASAIKQVNEKLFVYGVFILFLYEIILNMAVVLDITPSTGLPLPLVSSGGSSALIFLLMFGMVAGLGERL